MEFCLRHADVRETRRHAKALREYTAAEPLDWADLIVRRAEYLADRAEDPSRQDLSERREKLLREVEAADFLWLLRGI
jgi:hypothetical protein